MIQIARPVIGNEEISAVSKVLACGQLASGKGVECFEEAFRDYLGAGYAAATCNGTTALHAALLAVGVGKGDSVITTPFSFIATSNAILYTGATPVFADIDPETFNIDPEKIELIARTEKIKALVIVHLFGNPCDMGRISAICDKYDIALVEDCAQAHGAEYEGKKVGTFGKAAIFSFYPTKNMTCGEGGMVVTGDEEVYGNLKRIINHGQSSRYVHADLGYNYRMTDINAAIALEQLKKLEKFNMQRINNAGRYMEEISNPNIGLPKVEEHSRHVFNQFTIRCSDRDELLKYLAGKEIGYGVYYPATIPDQPVYKALGYKNSCSMAAEACKSVVSIPVHPTLEQWEVTKIIEDINQWRNNA